MHSISAMTSQGYEFINGSSNGSHTSGTQDDYDPSRRPLVLVHPPSDVRLSIPVSSAHDSWSAAEVARERFSDWITANPEVDLTLQPEDNAPPEDVEPQNAMKERQEAFLARQVVLLAHFLRFLSQSPRSADMELLSVSFSHFFHIFLEPRNLDIHSLCSPFDNDQRRVVLRAFFEARETIREQGQSTPSGAESQLFQVATPGGRPKEIYALFGGQGTNDTYFDELQALFDTYEPLIHSYLASASSLLSELAANHQDSLLYPYSLDPLTWLQDPSSRPPNEYLAGCEVSLSLMGLTQIAQYTVAARVVDMSPNEFRKTMKGATGHSQGVVSATIMSMVVDSQGWNGFIENALQSVKFLFYIGFHGKEKFPGSTVDTASVSECIDKGEGSPTPMLSVVGLRQETLQAKIDETNGHLVPEGRGPVAISLFNGLKAFVVTGPPTSLVGLVRTLRKGRAESGADQSKVPFKKRLPTFSFRFFPISVPYHSSYMAGATKALLKDLGESEKFWQRSKMELPVYNTFDGSDIRYNEGSLAEELANQIFTRPIHWAAATKFSPSATHLVDFGTGGMSGIGRLTAREMEGRGVRVAVVGGKFADEAYDAHKLKWESRWSEAYRPKLVKTSNGRIHLDTPFSRLLSKPPLMVAGMTPSTVQGGINAAVLNAGFHIELAGGGHYNERSLRGKVSEIISKLDRPGLGLTLNSLYINQRQWSFQFPLWLKMRGEGVPVEGFCVAAGIPSTEKSVEIISGLKEAGIRHVSFKPGSVEGIRQVISIAAANPDFPVVMQWTGGRAGGHHSPEDFHQPILSTYHAIRQTPNLVLVAGSGFGDADDMWPYLSGDWSVKFGSEPMPVDGFLLASRVMVAKEAHTSDSVKQLIVNAPGVDDADWEASYDKPTGGILTVNSELGEPIHKVATRGVKLWREFDDTVFSLPREKQAAWLEDNRDYVIKRLNADFQKPWFGVKDDGSPAEVGEMTYSQVLRRMVRLLYVSHERRWIDPSFRTLTGDWCRRTEERLSNVNNEETIVSQLQSYSELDDPHDFLDKYLAKNPAASAQILASEDVKYFLNICQRPGQKPVPFIPILDSSFSIWFKKDSLWQAEDIEAVFDQDPERVCILQGPVAARHSKIINEPVKDLMGNIEKKLIARILEREYNGDESKIPQVDYLAPKPAEQTPFWPTQHGISHRAEAGENGITTHIYDITRELPPTGEWLEYLSGPKESWLRAFLTSVSIQQGERRADNAAQRMFAPRPRQRVKVQYSPDDVPLKVEVFGAIRS